MYVLDLLNLWGNETGVAHMMAAVAAVDADFVGLRGQDWDLHVPFGCEAAAAAAAVERDQDWDLHVQFE